MNPKLLPGDSVTIEYCNASGESSTRLIDVRDVWSRGGASYVRAWCHLRDEERTFRCDRMTVLDRTTTGATRGISRTAPPVGTVRPPAPPSLPRQRPLPKDQELRAFVDRSLATRASAASGSPRHHDRTSSRGGLGLFATAVLFSAIVTGIICDPDTFRIFASDETAWVTPEPMPQPAPPTPEPAPAPDPTPAPQPAPAPAPPPAPKPEPQPAKLVHHEVPEKRTPTREETFIEHTGIDDIRILAIYRAADADYNERISWNEVQAFQTAVYQQFEYINNDTALPPDHFLAAGGGDCEDFSLFTCGMLEYWGMECWVGHLAPAANPRGDHGHAVVLVPVDSVPRGFRSVVIADTVDMPERARNRVMVPIDYEIVGGFTEATPRRWVLLRLYEPVKIYGLVM